MRYVDDLVTLYELEKARSQALNEANDRLTVEMEARRRAERRLRLEKRQFARKLAEKTRLLDKANARLENERGRRRLLEDHLRSLIAKKESEALEMRHRIRNDLQVLSSMLALHESRESDETVLSALRECRERIRSMALVHDRPAFSKNPFEVNFSEYAHSLVNVIRRRRLSPDVSVDVRVKCDPGTLHVSQATPCGLIINELVTNSFKHAFVEASKGEIHVSFGARGEDCFVLSVADTGRGFPRGFDVKTCDTLGLKLVKNLAELQLSGVMRLENENGAKVTVEFPAQRSCENLSSAAV
jgi:two-component sensor histidine kinase